MNRENFADTVFSQGLAVSKNGIFYEDGFVLKSHVLPGDSISVNNLVFLNGTTDYVELFVYSDAAFEGTMTIEADSWFTGYLIGSC